MLTLSTIGTLRAWARWGEGQHLDFPTLSPMFGERCLKTPLYGTGYAAPEILTMELAVCALEFGERQLIILRWQRHLSFAQIAARIGCSSWLAGRNLRRAEDAVERIFAIHHREAYESAQIRSLRQPSVRTPR